MVFLTSDILFFLTLFLAFLGLFKSCQHPNFKNKIKLILQAKLASISCFIFIFFLLIAVLDSIHFQTNSSFDSLLDKLLPHLKNNIEEGLSSPFAITEYKTQVTLDVNDVISKHYPALKYAGIHLQETARDNYVLDIFGKIFKIILVVLSLSFLLFFTYVVLVAKFNSEKLNLKSWVKEKLKKSNLLVWLSIYIFVILFITLIYLSFYYHPFGTDKVGRDVLYLNLKSIRTAFLVGLTTSLISLPISIILGISAGYFKGIVDDIIQYVYITLNSIPGILLIASSFLMIQVLLQNNPDWFSSNEQRVDLRLVILIVILGTTSWTGMCRLLRAETLKISQLDYIKAATASGSSRLKIIFSHIAPNLAHLILISVVMDFSGLVLAESILSYLGIGVDATSFSWGNMINDSKDWWILISAFIFMFILVLASNLLANEAQKVFEPRNY